MVRDLTDWRLVEVARWVDVEWPEQLLALVDRILVTEPYAYRPGEVPSAQDWFPGLVDDSSRALFAVSDGEPVGYGVALPSVAYAPVAEMVARRGMSLSTTSYLAELGVAERCRRRGIARALVVGLLDDVSEGARDWLVRTLEHNQPAIDLYEQEGFTLLSETEVRHGRSRVWLARPAPM